MPITFQNSAYTSKNWMQCTESGVRPAPLLFTTLETQIPGAICKTLNIYYNIQFFHANPYKITQNHTKKGRAEKTNRAVEKWPYLANPYAV
jgi:hypothetical protein